MAEIDDMIAKAAAKSLTKTRRPDDNLANTIAKHLVASMPPELVAIPGLWFSGSNVWKFLYGETPDPEADIDCFILESYRRTNPSDIFGGGWEDPRTSIMADLGLSSDDYRVTTVKTGAKLDRYAQGFKALYKGRKLDVWQGHDSVAATLRDYPESHFHCRAAFSFTEGLVVLPNEEPK